MFKKFFKIEEILKNNKRKDESLQENTEQQGNKEPQENREQQQQANNEDQQENAEQQGNKEPQENREQQQQANNEEQQENADQQGNKEPQENREQQQQANNEDQQENVEQQGNKEPQENREQQQQANNEEQQENVEQQENNEKAEEKNQQKDNKKEEEVEKKKNEAAEMFEEISKKSNPDHYNDVENELEDLDDDEIPDSVINVLINQFFNQQFRTKEDLNKKQDAYQEDVGDLKWNITDIIKHKVTKDLNKIRYDKHGLKKESGEGESIPLSFYFDLSGSMEEYIRPLSIMAYKMLEKGVKIIIGYNQNAYVQIEEIPNNYTIDKFEQLMSNLEGIIQNYEIGEPKVKNIRIDNGVEIRKLNGIEIDRYLIERKAEKAVVFSDFDPKANVEHLSEKCKTWWFCFREKWGRGALRRYKGKFYRTTSITDIVKHLKNIGKASYELKQRRLGEFGTEEYYYGIDGATKNSRYNTYVEDEGEKWYDDLYEER